MNVSISYFIYDKKTVHFYPESIVYLFVPFKEEHKGEKNNFFITNEEHITKLYTLLKKQKWLLLSKTS